MRLDAQLVGVVSLISFNLVVVETVNIVDLSRAKRVLLRGLQLNGIKVNLIQLGRGGVPVSFAFYYDQLPIQLPLNKVQL